MFFLSKQRGLTLSATTLKYMSMYNKEKQKSPLLTTDHNHNLVSSLSLSWRFLSDKIFLKRQLLLGFSLVSLKLLNLCQMESSLWCSLFCVALLIRAYPMLLPNRVLILKFLLFNSYESIVNSYT